MMFNQQFRELPLPVYHHETLNFSCCNGGPPSATLAQHYNKIGSTSRACRDRACFDNDVKYLLIARLTTAQADTKSGDTDTKFSRPIHITMRRLHVVQKLTWRRLV